MRYAFAQVAFGLGANALVARQSSQCVQLQASGGASGVLGQLSDGQNRVGGGHPTGCYCLSGNGGFTDSNGRGCILTPPTTQFQCDVGASPTTGFAIGSGGGVTYNGNGKFYACPVNDNGEYNVYTTPAPGQDQCVEISLGSAGSCGSGNGASATSNAAQSSKPAQTQPAQQSQPGYPASQPAPQSSKPAETQPAPKPSQPAQQSQPGYPASQPAKSSKPAETQPAPKPSQPAQQSQPGYSASKPAPQPSKPAPQPSQPAKPSQPAQESQPGYPASKPAPQPSQPAQSSKPTPQPSQPAQSNKPAPQPSQPAQSQPAPQPNQPAGACPADLNGDYQYPHLIVPVDSEQPSKAYGTSYNGKVDSHTCSIFNFDIPASYSGKTCTTVFLFPEQKDLETSSFTVSGNGKVDFTKLKGPASQETTYANQPGKESDLGSYSVAPGNSYTIASGDCAAGQTVSYEICGEGDFALDYFQDYNPSPIGLYVRSC